jgi:amino-acid N-acetyltransferase
VAPLNFTIRQPWREEWDSYRALLRQADLTVDGVGPGSDETFLVAVDGDGAVHGGVGLEGVGPEVLLRSLVVSSEAKGMGLGSALLDSMLNAAADSDAKAIYLLTTTAAAFFEARGFRPLDREQAPQRIRQSREFAVLCPVSAVLMVKTVALGDPDAVMAH